MEQMSEGQASKVGRAYDPPYVPTIFPTVGTVLPTVGPVAYFHVGCAGVGGAGE